MYSEINYLFLKEKKLLNLMIWNKVLYLCFFIVGTLVLWDMIIIIGRLPSYILPTPIAVFHIFLIQYKLILKQGLITLYEASCGFVLATLLGVISAIAMILLVPIRLWLKPWLVISQAIPTFIVAPLFVIWFGYGLTSKIITTILMLFFPITSAFFDGLCRANIRWIELGTLMGGSRWQILFRIKIPAALPALASGLRIATAYAPMGAVIGEWVGSSHGLGFLILDANARMQIDLMFACLIVLIIMSLLFYFLIDWILRKLITWQVE